MSEPPPELVCSSYTYARRHPLVLGRIGTTVLPFQVTAAQLGMWSLSFVALMRTWGMWAHLSLGGNVFVLLAVPIGLAWLVRRARVEGRDPFRAARGALSYLLASRRGVRRGRPVRSVAPTRIAARVFVRSAP